MLTTEKFSTICQDGVVIHGVLIIPDSPKAVLQFNGGTAAKKEFYLPFLNYLAENGYLCCLWDYRGSGDSAPSNLGKCLYNFQDYGLQDMSAIRSFLRNRFPRLPYLLFGHSVGGQQIGWMDNLKGIKGMVGFAVSTGYSAHMPLGYRLQTIFFFYLFSPISILLTGYVRAKRFGIMEDLPRNVVREWRAWCSKRTYFFDAKYYGKSVPLGQFANIPFPIHIFWATDDPISNKRSVPAFWGNITSTIEKTFTRIQPTDIGEKKLGHFGFFKKRVKAKTWPMALEKLDSFLES